MASSGRAIARRIFQIMPVILRPVASKLRRGNQLVTLPI
jgi:hypothetical protein